MNNPEKYRGIVGLYRNFNEKLRNAELVAAGVLTLFGQFAWAGVLTFTAGLDHAQVELAKWWQNRGRNQAIYQSDG